LRSAKIQALIGKSRHFRGGFLKVWSFSHSEKHPIYAFELHFLSKKAATMAAFLFNIIISSSSA